MDKRKVAEVIVFIVLWIVIALMSAAAMSNTTPF